MTEQEFEGDFTRAYSNFKWRLQSATEHEGEYA